MQIKTMLTSVALCSSLALFGGAAFADSHGAMDDAVIKADEAAEAADKQAEAVEEAKVAKEKAMAEQGAVLESEEVSGDMNPVDEGDAAQIKEPK